MQIDSKSDGHTWNGEIHEEIPEYLKNVFNADSQLGPYRLRK